MTTEPTGIHLEDTNSGLIGLWTLDVYEGDIVKDENGLILNRQVDKIQGTNIIVTVGKQMILDRLYGLSAVGAMTHTIVGANNTAAVIGNTFATMTTPAAKVFDAVAIRTALTVRSITTFTTAEANIVWAELALANSATGILLNRIAPIGPFTKTTAVSIIVTVDVSQT